MDVHGEYSHHSLRAPDPELAFFATGYIFERHWVDEADFTVRQCQSVDRFSR